MDIYNPQYNLISNVLLSINSIIINNVLQPHNILKVLIKSLLALKFKLSYKTVFSYQTSLVKKRLKSNYFLFFLSRMILFLFFHCLKLSLFFLSANGFVLSLKTNRIGVPQKENRSLILFSINFL